MKKILKSSASCSNVTLANRSFGIGSTFALSNSGKTPGRDKQKEKKAKHMSSQRSDQQKHEVEKRAQKAAVDLDGWMSMFRIGSLTINTEEDCRNQVLYARRVITMIHSPDHVAAGRELEGVATFVRSEMKQRRYPREFCNLIVEGLHRAAEYEKDPMVSCPWRECLEEVRSQPRLLALGKLLWAINPKGRREWTIDLDALKQELWGNEETPTSTVRSLVSEFRNRLKAASVPLTISVSDTRNNRRVSCALPNDFDFDMSW